jgi:hypothetical protein
MADASTTKVFTIGLSSLKAGEPNNTTGEMPSSGMAQHGNVYRDTLDMTTEDPTTEEYYEEEIDLPVASMPEAGKTTLTFEILRPSVADLVFWAGGEIDSTTGKTWKAPIGYVDNKKAIEINSKQGYKIEIPKAQIIANTTGGGAKSTPMRLKVTATVLVPTTSQGVSMSPILYTEPTA